MLATSCQNTFHSANSHLSTVTCHPSPMCYCCLTQSPLCPPFLLRPYPQTTISFEIYRLSVCLMTLNLHPRPITAYAVLHSDDCYFGIRGVVKSRLNTSLSYHTIPASVSIVEWVQIRSRVIEILDNPCSSTLWLVYFLFYFLIYFLPTHLLSVLILLSMQTFFSGI